MNLTKIVQNVIVFGVGIWTGYQIIKETKKMKEEFEYIRQEDYMERIRRNGL